MNPHHHDSTLTPFTIHSRQTARQTLQLPQRIQQLKYIAGKGVKGMMGKWEGNGEKGVPRR